MNEYIHSLTNLRHAAKLLIAIFLLYATSNHGAAKILSGITAYSTSLYHSCSFCDHPETSNLLVYSQRIEDFVFIYSQCIKEFVFVYSQCLEDLVYLECSL